MKKKFYERRVYESVDDRNLLWIISRIFMEKKSGRQRLTIELKKLQLRKKP